jgi:beta-lactamase superfamily II metal-dependent hydrolase
LPVWVQVVAWFGLWPLLLALLVMNGYVSGRARPIGAVVILAMAAPLWLAILTAGPSEPSGVEIAEAAPAEAAELESTEPEPATDPEPETGPEPETEPEPASDPEVDDEPGADVQPTGPAAVSGDLEVHFFDVGQGDATLLLHDEVAILIDTGRHQASDVVPYLRSVGVDTLDLVVVTHPHADHIGQFDKVVDAVTVTEVWWSGSTTTSQTFERAVTALEKSGAVYEEPRVGDETSFGPLQVEVVNPPSGVGLGNLHDANLAMRITYGEVRFLFTGDAEASTEARMVAQSAATLDADILQLGHHGSNTSTTSGFLAAVDPAVAVYSASPGNQYGHPHVEVLDRLAAADVEVYGTAVHGTVTITTDGVSWSVATDRSGTPTPGGSSSGSSGSSGSGSGGSSSPAPAPAPETADPGSCAPGQVDINGASFDDLQLIIHIGPERAQQVPGLRPFSSVKALDRISGIGPARLDDILAQGVACAG